jgi:hypothetical protein
MTDTKDKTDDSERDMTGRTDYPYLDSTRRLLVEQGRDDPATSAVLNPAYYPASTKPKALHGENEKKGADHPAADPDAEDRHQTGEQLTKDHHDQHPALYEDLHPGQIVMPPTHDQTGKARRVPPATGNPAHAETRVEAKR